MYNIAEIVTRNVHIRTVQYVSESTCSTDVIQVSRCSTSQLGHTVRTCTDAPELVPYTHFTWSPAHVHFVYSVWYSIQKV